MSILKKIKYVCNPYKVFFYLGIRGHFKFLHDETFVKLMYRCRLKRKLNLDNPTSYNEKLQWLKIHDRNPDKTKMVDKYEVKKYVASIIGEEYIIPTYGVWNSFSEIDFDKLPNQFVLKCTHDSGGIIICRDKKSLNKREAEKKLNNHLKRNYYWAGREWIYKNVRPRIIAEQFLVDESGNDLKDYKVMCFNGEPKLIELHTGRFTSNATQDFYDVEWKKTTISQSGLSEFQKNKTIYPRPKTLDEMLRLSKILAKEEPHVRIDWYSIRDQLYFGEMTFFDGSGFDPYDNYADDVMMGSWIDLGLVEKKGSKRNK